MLRPVAERSLCGVRAGILRITPLRFAAQCDPDMGHGLWLADRVSHLAFRLNSSGLLKRSLATNQS